MLTGLPPLASRIAGMHSRSGSRRPPRRRRGTAAADRGLNVELFGRVADLEPGALSSNRRHDSSSVPGGLGREPFRRRLVALLARVGL
jgi:hypothetical protein